MPNISNSGNVIATGTITGTGAAIQVVCGFTPSEIQIINITHEVVLQYNEEMAADHGYKTLGTGAGTISSTTATNSASALNVGTPVFSGTGQASAGQVITTTDNQTMTLNQCAGMLFISATHGPYVIASNTAVTGAPAVLTIIGTAPTTDAGIYKIVQTSAQVQASHTHTFTGSASENAYITTGGITLNANGFTIGTDADLNQIGDSLIIAAWRK